MPNPEHVEIVKQGAEAVEKWRKENPGERLDLSWAELSKIFCKRKENWENSRKANLTKIDLSEADLNYANLIEVDLEQANLSRAELYNADLRGANLRQTDLSQAKMRGANLSEASLDKADLRGTDLSGANSANTTWADLDLSQTIGLRTIQHHKASEIGIKTLIKSNGKIPNEFLRGCGLTDNIISVVQDHFTNSENDV
ncbi:pentapeptide repeat-containing protein [Gimesia sp.]|uniref:pentapeptide repeat-containing protein n=1 Tax=Gimesia sp. TaxID=2024833 RepID=UPI003A9438CD